MNNQKVKVLILGNRIMHYRVPIFNILSEIFDVTVVYSYPLDFMIAVQCKFKTLHLPARKISKFLIHNHDIFELCNQYDVVIAFGQIVYLKYSTLGLRKNKQFKLIYWGIGVAASYTRKYDQSSWLHNKLEYFLKSKADALVFYTDYPKKKYVENGYNSDALFTAVNTVEVEKIKFDLDKKDSIIFIGTLYKQKGIMSLFEEYEKAYKINNNIPILKIIGGGNDLVLVRKWILEHNLSDKILSLGPIYDSKKKKEIFETAIACFSPNQAGLSVLECMGYGIPFITLRDAITGGEIFNIENNVNGIILDNKTKMSEIILDIASNSKYYITMGNNAYNYYWNFRKPPDMAKGLIDAINYVSNK